MEIAILILRGINIVLAVVCVVLFAFYVSEFIKMNNNNKENK